MEIISKRKSRELFRIRRYENDFELENIGIISFWRSWEFTPETTWKVFKKSRNGQPFYSVGLSPYVYTDSTAVTRGSVSMAQVSSQWRHSWFPSHSNLSEAARSEAIQQNIVLATRATSEYPVPLLWLCKTVYHTG